jgi:hypothetical protein
MAVNINGTGSITGLSSISSPGISGVPVGSASAPAFSFTGDTNTGIYSPGADQVAVATNGTGRLFIDANGNVGVGTSSPANFAGFVTLALADSSGAEVDFVKGSTIQGSLYNASDIFYIESKSTVPTVFVTNGSERLRITSAGLVGIGTSSPTSAKLDVRDDANYPVRWGSTSAQFGELSYETGNCVIGATSGNKLTLRSAGTAAITIDSSQRVGIGTTSPIGKLSVSNSGACGIEFTPYSTYTEILSYNRSTSAYVPFTSFASTHTWNDGNGERLRIDSSGRVGIGTSSPNAILHVVGSSGSGSVQIGNAANTQYHYINFGGSSSIDDAWQLGRSPSGGVGPANGFYLYDLKNSETRLAVDTSGRVGIGTTSPSNLLHCSNSGGNAFVQVQAGSAGYSGLYLADGATGAQSYAGFIQYEHSTDSMQFGTGSAQRALIDSSGRLLVGTSTSAGSVSNTAPVVAGRFYSFNGSSSAVSSGSAITMFTAPNTNATYIVVARISSVQNASYEAVTLLSSNAGASVSLAATPLKTGGLMTISLSGADVQATQGSGGTATISWFVTRIN